MVNLMWQSAPKSSLSMAITSASSTTTTRWVSLSQCYFSSSLVTVFFSFSSSSFSLSPGFFVSCLLFQFQLINEVLVCRFCHLLCHRLCLHLTVLFLVFVAIHNAHYNDYAWPWTCLFRLALLAVRLVHQLIVIGTLIISVTSMTRVVMLQLIRKFSWSIKIVYVENAAICPLWCVLLT